MSSFDELLATPAPALLVGFGVANRAVAAALVARGHSVVALDDRPTDEARAAAEALGILALLWAARRFGLEDAERRSVFLRTGRIDRALTDPTRSPPSC